MTACTLLSLIIRGWGGGWGIKKFFKLFSKVLNLLPTPKFGKRKGHANFQLNVNPPTLE